MLANISRLPEGISCNEQCCSCPHIFRFSNVVSLSYVIHALLGRIGNSD